MTGMLKLIQEKYSLTDKELWLLTGVDFVVLRQAHEINTQARNVDLFNDKKDHTLSMAERDSTLQSLIEKGLVEKERIQDAQVVHTPYRPSINYTDKFILSGEFMKNYPMVCPRDRPLSTRWCHVND